MYVVLCKCIFGTFCCCTLKLEPTTKYKIFADTLLPESCFQYQVKQLSTLSLQHSEISQAGPEITTGTSYQQLPNRLHNQPSQPDNHNLVPLIMFQSSFSPQTTQEVTVVKWHIIAVSNYLHSLNQRGILLETMISCIFITIFHKIK